MKQISTLTSLTKERRGQFSSPWLVRFVWMSLWCLFASQGCSSDNNELERVLTDRLIQHRTDKVESIDLRSIFGDQWEHVCLQGPYMFQSDFEKRAGKSVQGFHPLSDDRYAIWVFYKDGHTSRVEIERIRVMEYQRKGTPCTSFQMPFVYFDSYSGEKRYFLDNAGRGR